ncbi:MAG: DUF4836 family protein [Ginsengibacter sp.]
MKSIFKLTVLLAVVLVILNSCSKTNNEVKMIPSNALVVMHLNTKSLTSKLSWDEIRQTNWYKELYSDTAVKTWTKKLMDNPAGSGIDLDAALVIFIQKAAGTDGQIVFEGSVKDAGAFEAFNKNLAEEGAVTTKDGDINMLNLKDVSVVGWNDKKFAYVINTPGLPANMNNQGDSINMNTQLVNASKNLSQVCKNLFALKTDSSMAKVDKFSSLLKEEGDVHVWQNTEEIIKSSPQMGMLSMLKLDVFLKGNISTATASFDNGKINVKQKFYVSAELTDLLKKYSGDKLNTDMIKNIPSQNINGFFALSFKPEGLKEIIKLTGLDGIINSTLSKQGITIDDFVKANKGDIMFAVTDFVMKKDSFNFQHQALGDSSFSYDRPSASYLFSVSIGDKPSFDKLMTAGKKLGGDLTESMGIYFAGNDKFFAIGNAQQHVSKYIAGSNNKFDFADKISGHPVALFVDLQKILSTSSMTTQPTKDSSNKIILDESLKIWQNVYSMGGEYKDDAFVMNSEINLVNKDTNSLKQLNRYFDRISKVIMEKKKKYEQHWHQSDSSDIYPPISMDTIPPNY